MSKKTCDVCGAEHSKITGTCDKCQVLVSKLKNRQCRGKRYGAQNVKEALKNAKPRKDEKTEDILFKCHYTEIYGKFNLTPKVGLDPLKDALVLTIDHKNPEDSNSRLVVSLYLINQMKNKLPKDKFKEIVITLGKYFNEEIEQEDFENKFKQLLVMPNIPKSDY